MHLDEIVGITACGQIQRLRRYLLSREPPHPESDSRVSYASDKSREHYTGKGVETSEQRGVTELCRGDQLVLDLIEPVHPEQMRITSLKMLVIVIPPIQCDDHVRV